MQVTRQLSYMVARAAIQVEELTMRVSAMQALELVSQASMFFLSLAPATPGGQRGPEGREPGA